LQVNNWNQNQKSKNVESELLHALNEEFAYNHEEVEKSLSLLQTVKSDMVNMLRYTGPRYEDVRVEKFQQLISAAGKDELEYFPSVGVIQDIINAGQLSNISNIELRRKLAAWESKLNQVSNQELIVESYRESIKDITIKNGNMVNLFIDIGLPEFKDLDASRLDTDPRKMLASQELENLIAYKIAATNSLEAVYQEVKKEIETILNLLDNKTR
jgi:hypothetical protein